MAKSAEAFRTISEVSEALNTPAHVLRFWESRFSQVKPVKRAGGRRYYRPADVALLGGIKQLLHEDGLTIRGVQKILREQGVKHVAAIPDLDELLEASAEVPAVRPRTAKPKRAPERPAPEAQQDMFAPDEAPTPRDPADEDDLPEAPMLEDVPQEPIEAELGGDNILPMQPEALPPAEVPAPAPPPEPSEPSDDADAASDDAEPLSLAARLRDLRPEQVFGREVELADLYLRLHALAKRMGQPGSARRE